MTQSSVSIIVPAFNEGKTIGDVVGSLRSNFPGFQIIVVDDGSNDNTAASAESAGGEVIRSGTNSGYGAAIKTGIMSSKSKYIVTFDADGQHKAEDLQRMLEFIDDYEMVIGSRQGFFHTNLWRMPGKFFLWILAQYLIGKKIPDINSGLRIVRRDKVIKYLHLCPSGYSLSTTITLAMISRGYNVKFVPISISPRKGKSRVNLKTGFDTIILILRLSTLFNPLKIFMPISIVMFMAALSLGLPAILIVGLAVGMEVFTMFFSAALFFGIGLISDQISQLRLEKFETIE